jgi:hypothetical protein
MKSLRLGLPGMGQAFSIFFSGKIFAGIFTFYIIPQHFIYRNAK